MDTPTPPVAPSTPPPHHPEVNNHMVMAVLSYLGILVLIPFFVSKDVPFVKFHIKQGAVLAIIEVVLWAVSGMFWGLWFIINLIQLVTFILSIIGIVNEVQNKEKELPLVGHLAKYINI
jgi:uncharacterized membrane protein